MFSTSIPWLSHRSEKKSTDPAKIQWRYGEDPTMRWKFSFKSGLEVVFLALISWLSHRFGEDPTKIRQDPVKIWRFSTKIRQRSKGWNSLWLRSTRPLSTEARSDLTQGCRQSTAGRSTSHPMWADRFWVRHKPNLWTPLHTSHSFLKPKTTYALQYFKLSILIGNIKISIYTGTIKSPS